MLVAKIPVVQMVVAAIVAKLENAVVAVVVTVVVMIRLTAAPSMSSKATSTTLIDTETSNKINYNIFL